MNAQGEMIFILHHFYSLCNVFSSIIADDREVPDNLTSDLDYLWNDDQRGKWTAFVFVFLILNL